MNKSGCKDPTAEIAIARVMREQRRREQHEGIHQRTHNRSQQLQENIPGSKGRTDSQGYDVVNPAELTEVIGDSFSYDEIMSIDLDLLNRCDVLVQLPGREESRGANIEYGYALGSDKTILPFECMVEGGCRCKTKN